MINPMEMSGRTVLVTGASGGLGRETAMLLSQLGARVVLLGRDMRRLDEAAARLAGTGHVVHAFDLTKLDQIAQLIEQIRLECGRIDGLAHFAGVSWPQPMRTWTPSVHEDVFRINVTAGLALVRGVRHPKVRGPSLSIVLLSSIAGLVATSGFVDYSASRGAVISATRVLALELSREGVRVNCVAPGLIQDTGMSPSDPFLTEDQKSNFHNRCPLGPGKGLDVAKSVAFLLSDASRWITGICLIVDGGVMLRLGAVAQ